MIASRGDDRRFLGQLPRTELAIDFTGVWQEADNNGDSADGTALRAQRFRIQPKSEAQPAKAAAGLD